MKIVDSGYKIDLHIHSVYSKGKDKGKVAFNTVSHVNTLVSKLTENGVQICAITDHDFFEYPLYRKLKDFETDNASSIIKVFPGVEFSVEFVGEDGNKVIHVISIFNDEDDEKVKNISRNLVDENGEIAYDRDMAFSEEKFLSILRGIDIDTILIAHQKSTLSTIHPYKNDVRTLGEDRFHEFIYTDYFEAFEFKNRKNEVFNKNFMYKNNFTESIRFITGSDCHDWREYPKIDSKDKTDFRFTYVKCIPDFRGLVMAITDHRRIKTINSFFNPTENYLQDIRLSIDGNPHTIPLSKGINVIIGDNSIGKSLLLHKLTGYIKKQDGLLKQAVLKGYETYLKNNGIEITTEISRGEIFGFDMQGEVRDKFEQGKLKSDDFLKQYYPEPIRSDPYKEKIQRVLEKLYNYLAEKYALDLKEDQLGKFQIIDEESSKAESLTFVGSVSRDNKKVKEYSDVSTQLLEVTEKLRDLLNNRWVSQGDKETIEHIAEQLDGLSMKYGKKKEVAELDNKKIALFQAAVNTFKQRYQSTVSDSQKKLSTFNQNMTLAAESICDLISRRKANIVPSLSLETETIPIATNRVYDYEFNSRLNITEINTNYLKNLIQSQFRKNTKSILLMSESEMSSSLLRYDGLVTDALEELKIRIKNVIENDFGEKYTITQAGSDKTQELSAGFNSKIYFDILSYETEHPGMYIIDQPEDNISQKSIREYLLDRFKVMGENRQVIIVTHNPQFIVNLDVDNVIYIGRDEMGKLYIQSGALEYKDDSCDILDIISTHIEGGLDTLRKRWKRYEKSTSL